MWESEYAYHISVRFAFGLLLRVVYRVACGQ